MNVTERSDRFESITDTYQAVSQLPQPNRDTIAYLMLHLQRSVADAQIEMNPFLCSCFCYCPLLICTIGCLVSKFSAEVLCILLQCVEECHKHIRSIKSSNGCKCLYMCEFVFEPTCCSGYYHTHSTIVHPASRWMHWATR